ncbi:hypothetical protein A6R68_20545, partial [Neotoma lepida]
MTPACGSLKRGPPLIGLPNFTANSNHPSYSHHHILAPYFRRKPSTPSRPGQLPEKQCSTSAPQKLHSQDLTGSEKAYCVVDGNPKPDIKVLAELLIAAAASDPVMFVKSKVPVKQHIALRNMVSGITVSDVIFKMFNVMKVFKSSMTEEDKKNSILEKVKKNMVEDMGQTMLTKDCCYALHYTTYEAKKSKKKDLGFSFWTPESEPLRNKIIYASSKDAYYEETENDQ